MYSGVLASCLSLWYRVSLCSFRLSDRLVQPKSRFSLSVDVRKGVPVISLAKLRLFESVRVVHGYVIVVYDVAVVENR